MHRGADSARSGAHRHRPPSYARQFVKSIQDLPQVKQVTIELDIPELCTVIEAPWPDDDARDPIYQAEGDLLRSHPDLEVNFLVVNRMQDRTRDYGPEPPEGMIYLLRR